MKVIIYKSDGTIVSYGTMDSATFVRLTKEGQHLLKVGNLEYGMDMKYRVNTSEPIPKLELTSVNPVRPEPSPVPPYAERKTIVTNKMWLDMQTEMIDVKARLDALEGR